MSKKKVRITGLPEKMATGGKTPYGQQTPGGTLSVINSFYSPANMGRVDPYATNGTLAPVPDDQKLYEAEKGEMLIGNFDGDGDTEMLEFAGKRHSEGGTAANKPGFIFSDTKKMALGGPILTNFGKSENTKKKFTPAELAKQYKLNEYKSVMDNPDADQKSKETAADNYQRALTKLQELAMVQEAMKGFPDGSPDITGMNPQGQIMAKYGGMYRKDEGGNAFRFDQNPTQDGINSVPNIYDYLTPPAKLDVDTTPREMPVYTPAVSQGQPTFDVPESKFTQRNPETPYTTKLPYNYLKQDIRSVLAAGMTPPHAYMPERGNTQLSSIHGTFVDPTRGIAAIAENANAMGQFAAQSGNGPQSRAAMSALQGQVLPKFADYISGVNTQNVGIANGLAEKNADIASKQSMISNEERQKYNAEMATALQNKDNATRGYINNLVHTLNNADKNRQDMYAMNKTSKYMYYDPSGKLVLKPGVSMMDYWNSMNTGSQSGGDYKTIKEKLMREQGMSEEQAHNVAVKAAYPHMRETYGAYGTSPKFVESGVAGYVPPVPGYGT